MRIALPLLVALVIASPLILGAADPAPSTRAVDHQAWINSLLDRMDELRKPGATYADFDKLFVVDAGLNPIPAERFGLRECPAIKVTVTFKDVERGKHPTPASKIASISTPYIERPYMD
jgi:hypothetical protein